MGRLMGPDIEEPAADAISTSGVPLRTQRPAAGVQLNTDAPPARYIDTARLPVGPDQIVTRGVAVGRRRDATAEPPIEPSGWSPFQVAALRGLLLALGTAASVFFLVWKTTNDEKTIIIATGGAFVSVLMQRFAGEGVVDQARFERTRQ